MKQQAKHYDRQFKLDVVEHYLASKKTIRQIADNFGINHKTLYAWIKEYKTNGIESFRGQGIPKASNEELLALKKELADVKMERDILKKAAAIFLQSKK